MTDLADIRKVLVLGDIHGDFRRLHQIIREASERLDVQAVIQVGDFGFSGMGGFEAANNREGPLRLPLYVIDGNHEDHEWLYRNRHTYAPMGVTYQPRGSMVEIGGRRVGFMGGALNIDRPQGGAGATSNYVTADNVAGALYAWRGAEPHVIISHTCPTRIGIKVPGLKSAWVQPAIQRFIRDAGLDPGDDDDPGDAQLTHLWGGLALRPAHWIFGHFHQLMQASVGLTTFTCAGCSDGTDRSPQVRPVILNLETLTVTIVNGDGLGEQLPRR